MSSPSSSPEMNASGGFARRPTLTRQSESKSPKSRLHVGDKEVVVYDQYNEELCIAKREDVLENSTLVTSSLICARLESSNTDFDYCRGRLSTSCTSSISPKRQHGAYHWFDERVPSYCPSRCTRFLDDHEEISWYYGPNVHP